MLNIRRSHTIQGYFYYFFFFAIDFRSCYLGDVTFYMTSVPFVDRFRYLQLKHRSFEKKNLL